VAPPSSKTNSLSAVGIIVAMAGRSTESSRPSVGSRGHQTAGIAGRNHGLSSPFLYQIDRARHGAILLLADRASGIVIHGEDFAGMNNANSRVAALNTSDPRFNLRLVADQVESWMAGFACSPSVAPSMSGCGPWSPPITSTPMRIKEKSAGS